MTQLLMLGTADGALSVRHPAHRSPGGEWDGLAALPRDVLRSLTGAGILTPHGELPDVAAMEIGVRVGRPDMTPDELADWLRRVAYVAVAERRTVHQRRARQRRAAAAGFASYYELRNAQAVAAGYRSLWHRRCVVWPDSVPARLCSPVAARRAA